MRSAAAHLETARRLYLKKDCNTALREVNKALEHRKKYHSAYILKGNILFELDQDEAALECHARAIEIRPSHYEAYDCKASTLLMMSRATEAEPFARKSLSLVRKQTRTTKENIALVYDTLAKVLLARKKEKQAVAVLREGQRRTNSTILQILLAQILDKKQSGKSDGNSKVG